MTVSGEAWMPSAVREQSTRVLLMAAWFGLVTGLLEGVGFLALQKLTNLELPWLEPLRQDKKLFLNSVSLEIVWISALCNLLLFGVLGVVLAGVARILPRLPLTLIALYTFVFLACLDWVALAVAGPIQLYAVFTLALGLTAAVVRWVRKHEVATLRFWRRSLPWITAMALLALVGIQGGLWLWERLAIARLPAAPPDSPNILVIMVDTLRADHLSSYGYARLTSPHIDRIAREGVLFENAFSTSSWTLPSHASLLTGRYPYEHGVEWHTPRALLMSRYPTLPEALRARGYRTAAFSANLFWFTRDRLGRGFIRFEDYFHSIGDMVLRTNYGRAIDRVVLRRLGCEDIPARKRAAEVNRSFLRWIGHTQGKPFFAFLNYMDTHDPYLPPQPYRGKFSQFTNPGGILNLRLGNRHPQTPEQLQGEIDAYDGAIAYVDDHIGQLLTELQKRGLSETTLVVITSDHGESFGEHGLFLHAHSLYRELIQVPLVFWWPGHVPAGVRVARPVTNAALPATVMHLVDAGGQTAFPGPPLTQLWEVPGVQPDWPCPLAELAQQSWRLEDAPTHSGWMKSLVSPQWHYIVHEKLGTELYDWSNDPQELHNLAEGRETQGVVMWFQSQLHPGLASGQTTATRPVLNDGQ